MSTKYNTQKSSSNTGGRSSGSKGSSNRGYGSFNESAVHKPVPGRGGKGGKSK